MKGKIFDIQKFCINDGPGIRTTVFLKGCPLKCAWCHNPESQSGNPQLAYDAGKCLGCGRCAAVCPHGCHSFSNGVHSFDRSKCAGCGKCIDASCPALSFYGSVADSDEIIADVLKDKVFYETSGGGITISGGEPLAQPDFCVDLLKKAKEQGLHTCIETSGFASAETIEKTLPLVDIYLFDCKETDPENHKKYIGQDNAVILKNLRMISQSGGKIILRCPIIPGVNDRAEHFSGIAKLAEELDGVSEIQIEPYHSLGKGKYSALGMEYSLESEPVPDSDTAEKWIGEIQKHTQKKVSRA